MIDRTLEENEEVVGDKIASIFYTEIPSENKLYDEINSIISTEVPDKELKEYIIETTIDRLYSEKANRRDYIIEKLKLDSSKSPTNKDLILLELDPKSISEEDKEQYSYFLLISKNLAKYELEQWEEEIKPIFTSLDKETPESLEKIRDDLKKFSESVYSISDSTQLLNSNMPKLISDHLKKLNLLGVLNRYDTLYQQGAFSTFLQMLCTIIAEEKRNNTEPKKILVIATRSTIHIKTLLKT